jgi:uncharacterized membrane protein YgdD (TMEM256/DUF423 family)
VGAHVLQAHLDAAAFETFSTAVTYLLLHAVVLLVCGLMLDSNRANLWFKLAGLLLVLGILLFSGGLMMRIVTGIPALARGAPLGGSALILAWVAIAVGGLVNPGQSR